MSGADRSHADEWTKDQSVSELESEPRPQSSQSRLGARPDPGVYKARIFPIWFADNTRFWYRNDLSGGTKEFVVVDAEKKSRQPAFDHARLAAALSRATGRDGIEAARLPIERINFVDDDRAVRFSFGGSLWTCDLDSYQCTKTEGEEDSQGPQPSTIGSDAASPRRRGGPSPTRQFREGGPSADGKWAAFVRDGNVFVRSLEESENRDIQLSHDGTADIGYGMLRWSPDSQTLIAFRIEPGESKEVFLIESSPREGGRAVLHRRPYALPGDKFTTYELNLFDVQQQKQLKPPLDKIELGFGRPRLHFSRDGSSFCYEQVDRGHQRFRVIKVDHRTGQFFNILEETTKTFIWTAHTENLGLDLVTWLEKTDEIIYASERDGWRHLYLVDAQRGGIKNAITQGQFVVRGIDHIDEENRQLWFRASGRNADQDPYFIHYYRVDFDGTNLVALTEGNGNHSVQFSPDRKYLIDTYSSVDQPPRHELRRTSDGQLVCPLEQADISELVASGWSALEPFVAKGRDGVTDIWGVICRPKDFDPSRKYPIIESIYAGPQGSFVPKSFSAQNRYTALANLGFIVVQIDGMGTANRSKAFHDVCWHNLKDAGLPDRILWIKAAAAKYPYMDLNRVGVYGTSAGGQNATAAVLFHGDFYKVAVSGCGCHDNRMDKASWNEQWMGYPVGPQYSECSNIDNAHRLRGKLLLIVGEMDTNVPPESTMRLADALIKANKDFEMLVVPGAGHGMGGEYGVRRMHEFFVRHLQGAGSATEAAKPLGQAPAATGRNVPPVVSPPTAFFDLVGEADRDVARQFYTKYLDILGLPVVASSEVADAALQRAHWMVTHMLAGRPDIAQALVANRMYLIIIGKDQVYTDMPEYRSHPNPAFQNERVRGTGGRPTSFGEENLLSLPLDRYDDESIGVHEFCHTIDGALRSIDPAWTERRNAAFRKATAQGLWKNTYAASNPAEYWAEICQSYFDCNRVNNWNHGPIGTREQLKAYDPDGYELVHHTFQLSPNQDWRYTPLQRLPCVIAPPPKFRIDPYYTKFTWAREFHVLGRHACHEALLKVNDTIRKMFAYRHDILKALIDDGVRLVVLGRHERLADLPELVTASPSDGRESLARVYDYTPVTKLLVVPEENVLGNANESPAGPNPVIRVFAKTLYDVTAHRPIDPNWERRGLAVQQYELRVQRLDVRFDRRLQELYNRAIADGQWKGTTAANDRVSYWVAGVLAYFDAAGQVAAPTDAREPIATREALEQYDPALYELVHETMAYGGHEDWRSSTQ